MAFGNPKALVPDRQHCPGEINSALVKLFIVCPDSLVSAQLKEELDKTRKKIIALLNEIGLDSPIEMKELALSVSRLISTLVRKPDHLDEQVKAIIPDVEKSMEIIRQRAKEPYIQPRFHPVWPVSLYPFYVPAKPDFVLPWENG